MVFFYCLKKICIKNRLKKKQKKKKEKTIPDWVKVGNYSFERIKEKVNEYVNKGWHSKVGKKSITMNPVKIFLQDIVSGKFNNAGKAKKMYLDNAYEYEQKMIKSDNGTDCKKDMIKVYDQVKKNSLLLLQYLIWIIHQPMINLIRMKKIINQLINNQTLQIHLN